MAMSDCARDQINEEPYTLTLAMEFEDGGQELGDMVVSQVLENQDAETSIAEILNSSEPTSTEDSLNSLERDLVKVMESGSGEEPSMPKYREQDDEAELDDLLSSPQGNQQQDAEAEPDDLLSSPQGDQEQGANEAEFAALLSSCSKQRDPAWDAHEAEFEALLSSYSKELDQPKDAEEAEFEGLLSSGSKQKDQAKNDEAEVAALLSSVSEQGDQAQDDEAEVGALLSSVSKQNDQSQDDEAEVAALLSSTQGDQELQDAKAEVANLLSNAQEDQELQDAEAEVADLLSFTQGDQEQQDDKAEIAFLLSSTQGDQQQQDAEAAVAGLLSETQWDHQIQDAEAEITDILASAQGDQQQQDADSDAKADAELRKELGFLTPEGLDPLDRPVLLGQPLNPFEVPDSPDRWDEPDQEELERLQKLTAYVNFGTPIVVGSQDDIVVDVNSDVSAAEPSPSTEEFMTAAKRNSCWQCYAVLGTCDMCKLRETTAKDEEIPEAEIALQQKRALLAIESGDEEDNDDEEAEIDVSMSLPPPTMPTCTPEVLRTLKVSVISFVFHVCLHVSYMYV